MAARTHVFMFPWLAFGHILPYLELSKRLAEKGIFISFISSPRNIERLPPIPQNLTAKIKLIEIQLPVIQGLPENCEATVDLPQQGHVDYLKKANDGLQAQFETLLRDGLPDVILFDFVSYWIPSMASKLGIPSAFLSAYTASTLAVIGPPSELCSSSSLWSRPEDFSVSPGKQNPFSSLVDYRPAQRSKYIQYMQKPNESGVSAGQRWGNTLDGCDFVAVRSCSEFEGEYLKVLEEIYQKPVFPIGLLPPSASNHPDWSSTYEWLDKREEKSVVFVGFGSEYKMPVKQVHELAYGIELFELPFIWILRKPAEFNSLEDFLPPGFLARTTGRGLVCTGWAPQPEILAHPSIGGCLFHSGWGSIIETLSCGHPLILLPMVNDQFLNVKVMVENGAGHEVQKNGDGSFDKDAVAKAMRIVMVDKEGESIREKAAQLQGIFASHELHDAYVNRFVQYLSTLKKKDLNYAAVEDAKEV